jgi:polar amino acid transport system permease protein
MSPQIAQYWLVFLKGAGITLWLSWLALMMGGVVGVGIALARLSPWRLLRGAALAYTEVLRSFPPLILFFGCFYGISYAFGLDLSPFAAATVALSAQASAFMSEVVRSGVESVGRGQWEAARSSGLAYWQIMRHVVGPQAVPVMLPPAVGVYISTLKDSSLASVIGYVELTKAGMLVRETTGISFEVFVIVAAMYFLINYFISLGGAALERKFRFQV